MILGRTERPPKRVNGPYAQILRIALAEDEIKGDPRNYAILDGTGKLTTYLKQYDVAVHGEPADVTVPDKSIDPDRERRVIHRRHLWKYLGPEQARRFWRFGRRTRA